MDRPIHHMLLDASRRTSLHMPGAQGRRPFGRVNPYRLDTTELPITDDLYEPRGAIARAQALAAASAGAAHTLLLHGGSTAGIHAMLLYAARRGDQVILPRNAHISAVHLCALCGIEPVFAQVCYTALGRPYTTLQSYIEAMDGHPGAKAALVVRPDFYGAMCDLEGIARAAHERGMLALCDEAHGAHFNWDGAHPNALACGADLAVQSAHKTLPALTAGAWLHAGEGVEIHRLRKLLRMVQTSSPSFVGMLSLDDARAWMDKRGAASCRRLREAAEAFRKRAAALGYGDGQADFPPGMDRDRLRLVLSAPQGGFRLEKQLAAQGIDVEMSDDGGVVCILSLMDGPKRLERLYRALRRIPAQAGVQALCRPAPPGPPPRDMALWEAAFADSEAVPPEVCVGRVSAGQAGVYPPGVAVVTAGERVTREMMDYLATVSQEHLFGVNPDGGLNCVRIKEQWHE